MANVGGKGLLETKKKQEKTNLVITSWNKHMTEK